MLELEAGDIIFYRDDGKWFHRIFTKLQKWFGEMAEVPEQISITHVAMVSTEPDLVIEMRWPRPRFAFFADDTRKKVVKRVKCPDAAKIRAVYWCYLNFEKKYSFLNMLFGKMGLKNAYKCCSGWLNRAYAESGVVLVDAKDRLVSPNELFMSENLETILEV